MSTFIGRVIRRLPFKRKERPEKRTIRVGFTENPVNVDVPGNQKALPTEKFMSNRVISSKYTILNFIPKNLFEQFQRIANFYFLVVLFISIFIDSPVSPLTTGLPLGFVVFITALKQGYEDFLRHKADNEVNKHKTYVLKDGMFVLIESQKIRVGDLVKTTNDQPIPCDLAMISSSEENGECFITTANLDGETSLKTFRCLPTTRCRTTEESLNDLKLKIECEQPTIDLYKFVGNLKVIESADNEYDEDDTISQTMALSAENVLLRGSYLKNTTYTIGCAIYTGQETKMALNSRKSSVKFSRIEQKMNKFLLFFLLVLLIQSAVLVGLKYNYYSLDNGTAWYREEEKELSFLVILEEFLSFMVLLNYTIPISMYVTAELQKFFGSMFFEWDIDMYDKKLDENARAITSDLNEELGQIQYLFTDKTGTLTENNMKFRQCYFQDTYFLDINDILYRRDDDESVPVKYPCNVVEFLKMLALCHTVTVSHEKRNDGVVNPAFEADISLNSVNSRSETLIYEASSPDEKALIEACKNYGVVYKNNKDNVTTLSVHGQVETFKILSILEFDPTRKRMSVLVEDENENGFLLVKGADSHMVTRFVNDVNQTVFNICSEYSKTGLRTLVFGRKSLSREELKDYQNQLNRAHNSVVNHDKTVSDCYERLESDLTFMGVTAVEDELQDGVPETLTALRQAGIKVWVLTGDKEETAVNISYLSGHFTREMTEMRITNRHDENDCREFLLEMKKIYMDNINRQHALILDGQSLAIANTDALKGLLREVCMASKTVLCCRMSPIQKAVVVKLIKESKINPTTAAIGDGANDVSMIQEAHVGIGLMGKEGRQAVRASDYAFGRFKFLQKCLLVHGHYFYVRLATLVQYFFYKNVAFITANVYFAFFSAYSAQSLYDGYFLMLYNIAFTSLPILLYGLYEQHLPTKVLMNRPELYRNVRSNARLSWKQFAKWNILGVWHSVVSFFGIYFIFNNGNHMDRDGMQYGIYDMGAFVYTLCILTVNIKLMLHTYYWCIAPIFSFTFSFFAYFVMTVIYSAIKWPSVLADPTFIGSFIRMCKCPQFWLIILGLVTISLIPDIIVKSIEDFHVNRKRRLINNKILKPTTVSKTLSNGNPQINYNIYETDYDIEQSTDL